MADLKLIKPLGVQNIINKFCLTIGMIPSSYKLSLTYEEQILSIGKFLEETVIPALNNNAEAVAELQALFVQLKDYVENYFDDLNLQDEINNKLEEMAQSGELDIIIGNFLKINSLLVFNNIEDLKSSNNLIEGSVVETLGYYSINDGGKAKYKIVSDNSLNTDESFVILLNSGLKAVLQFNDKVNIRSLGARSQNINNEKFDIKPYIEKYLQKLDELQNKFTLYFPSGVWYCSALNILNEYGFCFEGAQPSWQGYASGGTTISSYENNQPYIFKIGSSNQMVNNFSFKNITLSSGDFLYFENGNNFRVPDANTKRIQTALELYYAGFGIFENLAFNHIVGEVMGMTSSWEFRFDKLFVSNCSNINGALIHFRPIDTSLNENANISNVEILELNVEAINGNIIQTDFGCNLIDTVINNFHFEPFTCNLEDITQHELNDGQFDANNVKHLSLIDFKGVGKITINNIFLNNIAYRYLKLNNNQYIYDTILNITNTSIYAEIVAQIGNIMIQGMNRTLNLVLQETLENTCKNSSVISLDNISNTTPYNCIFNVKNFPTILNKAILRNTRNLMLDNSNNDFNAFCKYTRNADNATRRYLNYDPDVINNEWLCVKPNTTTTGIFANTSMKGNKIFIRAKVENGKTYKLTISNLNYSRALTFDIAGTGQYKLYELDMTPISAFLKDDPRIILYSANTNTEDIDVSLDYFFFE